MPPPKKYDNKILHVGPVEVFWHFRQNFPNFTRFFPQILDKKVSLSDVIKISYVVSTCRTWWSFFNTFGKIYPILHVFYPNFGEKSVPKWWYQNGYVVSTYRTWWCFLTPCTFFPPKFGHFFAQILGKKVSLSDDIKIAM